MNKYSDEKIIDSWDKNAAQWAAAVRGGKIASRKLITDKAIIETVLSHSPESVLDIGCGEGWLIRELAPHVTYLVGLDVVPGLIDQAQTAGGGQFFVASYDALVNNASADSARADGAIQGPFDVVVGNFSLLGKESVELLFSAITSHLNPGGVFIVQTLHPVVACGDLPYVDGWREGSWAGFGSDFVDPAPWYFRTIENWSLLFSSNGFQLLEVYEPLHPTTHKPASIIFTGAKA